MRKTLFSILGGLAAAAAVLAASPVVNWRTGLAAFIAFLTAIGVPTVYSAPVTAPTYTPPSEAATPPLIKFAVHEGEVPAPQAAANIDQGVDLSGGA